MSNDILQVMTTAMGVLVVGLVWADFIATVMTASATGTFARRFSHFVRRWFRAVSRITRSHNVLAASGPCITILLLVAWFGLAWIGWSLIYLGTDGSVIGSTTRLPADAAQTIYFVGFALTTLGTGDYIPGNGPWAVLSVLVAFNGLALITLAITYAIPVVQAAAEKRTVSVRFALWGATRQRVLAQLDHEGAYQAFHDHLAAAASELIDVTQKHMSYPILHFFHSPAERASLSVQIAILDETIRALPDTAFEKEPKLQISVVHCARGITEFLTTLNGVFVTPSDESPPPAQPERPDSIAVRLVTAHSDMDLVKRRKLLKALVEEDGWTWETVSDPDG